MINEILFAALVVLNALDVYTTVAILKQGGSEVNPAMAWLMRQLGVAPAMIVAKTIVLGAVWFLLPQVHTLVLVGLVCFYVWVVLHNFGQIKK